MSGPDISEDTHDVTLKEERVVVAKETVPPERVRLEKETVTEEQPWKPTSPPPTGRGL